MKNLDHLIEFASQCQLDYIEAIRANGGSHKKAAEAIGVPRRTLGQSMARLVKHAAQKVPLLHDYANGNVPSGFNIKGASQYDPQKTGLMPEWTWTSGVGD